MLSEKIEKMLQVAASRCVLNRLPGEFIPDVAVAALEEGIENDEIIELAGMERPTFSEVKQVFLDAILKLRIHIPNVREATLCLAKELSEKIITGSISPYEGARKIWWELSNIEGADERLKIFAGLASEIEDTQNTDFRKDYEKQIIEEAGLLVKAS
jgi:hypothetical protein